jgi:hypothetical protein
MISTQHQRRAAEVLATVQEMDFKEPMYAYIEKLKSIEKAVKKVRASVIATGMRN